MYVVCMNVQRLVVVFYSLSILSLCARSVLNNLVCIHVTVSSWRIVRPFADIYQTLEPQIALSANESTRHPTFAVRKNNCAWYVCIVLKMSFFSDHRLHQGS